MPLLIKKNVVPSSNDPQDRLVELSNFDAIVKINKNPDCRQKEKKKGGDEEGRSSLMPKPNEILQQVYKMFHPS